METKAEFLAELSRCVVEMEDDDVAEVAEDYAAHGYEPVSYTHLY